MMWDFYRGTAFKLLETFCFPLDDGKVRFRFPAFWGSSNTYVVLFFIIFFIITVLRRRGVAVICFTSLSFLWPLFLLLCNWQLLYHHNPETELEALRTVSCINVVILLYRDSSMTVKIYTQLTANFGIWDTRKFSYLRSSEILAMIDHHLKWSFNVHSNMTNALFEG